MTNQHPIRPSPELVSQWRAELPAGVYDGYKYPQRETELCIQSAQWGADQELEACCEWLIEHGYDMASPELIAARRLSLKEQALAILDNCSNRLGGAHENIIRRALEELPND